MEKTKEMIDKTEQKVEESLETAKEKTMETVKQKTGDVIGTTGEKQ